MSKVDVLLGLQWGDIAFGEGDDDANRYILVQRSYDRRWSRRMLTPKNKKSRRVDMSRELRRVLIQLRDERLAAAVGRDRIAISDQKLTVTLKRASRGCMTDSGVNHVAPLSVY